MSCTFMYFRACVATTYLPSTTTDIDGGSSLACRIETGAGKVQHDISYYSESAFPQIVYLPISGGEVFVIATL